MLVLKKDQKKSSTFLDTTNTKASNIKSLYREYLKSMNNNNRKSSVGMFSPSMLAYCPRQQALKFIGADTSPTKIPNKLRLILEEGTAIHDLIQGILKNIYGDLFIPEVTLISKQYKISGRCDGIFKFDSGAILEIKGIGKSGFKSLYKPKEDHVRQLNTYLKITGFDIGYLWYFCRDDLSDIMFTIGFSQELWEGDYKILQDIEKSIEENKWPVRDDGNCIMCRYSHVCKSDKLPRDYLSGTKN